MSRIEIKPYEELDRKIYAYTLPEVPTHDGYVKIGETNRIVKNRIREQVGTAGLNPNLLFEKLARKNDGTWFSDKDLHKYLEARDIQRANFNNIADEWFYFNGDLHRAEELTDEYIALDYDEIQINKEFSDYELRKEQKSCVAKTYEYYQSVKNTDDISTKRFLWNAKPRFGKTLTCYDFILKIKAKNILIITNRPAIANSWYDDFYKFISWRKPYLRFVSETEALSHKAYSRNEYVNNLAIKEDTLGQVVFLSLQDLKGAKFAGGEYDKLEWVRDTSWDILVIDEAHEGVDTKKTDDAFKRIERDFELHLSGTPFKALQSNKFSQEQIYNWSYLDEQSSKENWIYTLGKNPYENLPTLNLFTYQMSHIVEEKVEKGLTIEDDKNIDYAFDLNEFFSTKDNGKFQYEDSVRAFLDNLCKGDFPFAKEKYRQELNHTFWLLRWVSSAKAMEDLLNKHPVFKDYKTVLAAGDGLSLKPESSEKAEFTEDGTDLRSNEKSFDKVKRAIRENEKTITLSVGQLTTGITIKEWTGVFMLNNIKSPSLYFQAAFRAQNPYEFEKDGKLYRKENSYVFDFAPDRTLELYSEFAENLNPTESPGRKNNIRELLNFFPVIGEDEDGKMIELNAEDVLTIPQKIRSEEVVKRGFMSNLLFKNIYGIFQAPREVIDILEKVPPEENKKFGQLEEIEVNEVHIDDDGNVDIPKDIVVNDTKNLFGEKIYKDIDLPPIEISEPQSEELESEVEKITSEITSIIRPEFDQGFKDLSEEFGLNKSTTAKIEKTFQEKLESGIKVESQNLVEEVVRYTEEKEEKLKLAGNEEIFQIEQEYEKKTQKLVEDFQTKTQEKIQKSAEEVVRNELEKVETKKKDQTENQVRDHLRGFTRTIPSFLMAYGDKDTRLDNFEKNIEPEVFEEITSISIEEFKRLRDGFDYVDESGNNRKFEGLFDEFVFNASIKGFLNKKIALANYFDESLGEDIFSYIPPQKTNQIYTPKRVVKMMVDKLEEENPDLFTNYKTKFVDLYSKSGLYLTEIVKRLNQGLSDQIPNEKERIKWILENQVYGVCPSKIIYNIVRNYVYGDFVKNLGIETDNIVLCDTAKSAQEGNLKEDIEKAFGGEEVKFDVIIGNPPYQDETLGDNKTFAPPIYHKFMDQSYELSDKVLLITPARFLFNAGSTPKSWNRKMLNDEHLKVILFENNPETIFPNTDIKGGLTVTYRDNLNKVGPIGTFVPQKTMRVILDKVLENNFVSLGNLVYSRTIYRFSDKMHEDYPNAESMLSKGHKYDISSNIFQRVPMIFENYQIDSNYIKIFGRLNNERVEKWMKREYLVEPENFNYYKIIVTTANGSGKFGEILSYPFVANPLEGNTETFINIGCFDNKMEAENLLSYIKTKFARSLLSTLKVTQTNTKSVWMNIPLQDFTENSDIDWSLSIPEIDQALYKKYNLSEEEKAFIEENVQPMD